MGNNSSAHAIGLTWVGHNVPKNGEINEDVLPSQRPESNTVPTCRPQERERLGEKPVDVGGLDWLGVRNGLRVERGAGPEAAREGKVSAASESCIARADLDPE
jgi:hypothetical protein